MPRLLSKGIALAAALMVVAGAAVMAERTNPYAEAAYIAEGVADFKQLSDRFAALAQDKGGVYAFEVLKRAPLPPQTDLHLLGHVVGDELYKQKNIEGIADCTQDFRNACSHSVVIGALNEYGGEGALPLIRESCKKAPGGSGAYTMCYHGLGHGVFAYFGYSLPETAAFCKKTGTEEYRQQEYVECVGGAIMELMGGGGHDPQLWQKARERYLLEEDALLPCTGTTVPPEAKEICLAYLTPRLMEFAGADLGRPDPATFPRAFSFCDPLVQPSLRHACYGGFGKEFVPLAGARDIRAIAEFSDREFLTALEWCKAAGAEDGIVACVTEGLASVFWGGENDPAAAVRFCSLAEGAERQPCFARLAQDIRMYIPPGDAQQSLCRSAPELQEACDAAGV